MDRLGRYVSVQTADRFEIPKTKFPLHGALFGSVPIPCEIPKNRFAEAIELVFNTGNGFIRPLHSPHPLSAHGVDGGDVLLFGYGLIRTGKLKCQSF